MIKLDPNIIQIGKKGDPFKVIAVSKGENEKWINGTLKFNYTVLIRYVGTNNYKTLYFNHNDEIYDPRST
jgi:hypothetical protein